MPLHEIMGPWIQPVPFAPEPTPPIHPTKFDAGLAATIQAAKAPEAAAAKADFQAAPKKAIGLQKPVAAG